MKMREWMTYLFCSCLAITIGVLSGCASSGQVTADYDTLPKLREYNPPVYPERILLSGQQEEVTLLLRIDGGGNVQRASIVKSSGESDLDSAALAAAKSWKYYPATKDGKPLPIVIHQNVVFSTKTTESVSFYEILVERKAFADSLWDLLELGADFSDLAKKFSEGKSAAIGGLRETVRYDSLPEVVRSALQKLAPGQHGRPFEFPDEKFMIVKRKKA